jgi:hypothetical protein
MIATVLPPIVYAIGLMVLISFLLVASVVLLFTWRSVKADLVYALETLDEAEAALTPPVVRHELSSARIAVRRALNLLRDGAP